MSRRRVSKLLIWLAVWGLLAAVLSGLYLLAGSAAPDLGPRLLPFFVIDLLVVFPIVSLAAAPITRSKPKWSRGRRTRIKEPARTAAGSGGRDRK